jgi:hypothetical protein
MIYPWLLTAGALIVIYFALLGASQGEYGGKYYTVRRAGEPLGFWLRIAFAVGCALALLAVAWLPLQLRDIVAGLGGVLVLSALIAAVWGETVIYRRVPLRRRESPLLFWLHVLGLLATGAVVLVLPWLIRR